MSAPTTAPRTSCTTVTTSTTVDAEDEVSALSFGTAPFRPPHNHTTAAAATSPATLPPPNKDNNNNNIPNFIFIPVSIIIISPLQKPPQAATAVVDDCSIRRRRQPPRGSVHSYAIGEMVGQSKSLAVASPSSVLASTTSSTAGSSSFRQQQGDSTTTCSRVFGQTRRANRKLNKWIAGDDQHARRQPTTHPLVGEVLYVLEKVYQPVQQRLRRRANSSSSSSMYVLHPSPHGCLV